MAFNYNFKTVMVVEDDQLIRDTMKQIVEAEGYVCFAAENGKEALAKLAAIGQEHKPCLILTDLMMPIMNGYEFLEELEKMGETDSVVAEIPVITVSAFSKDGKPGRAKKYIAKPFTLEAIINALKECCSDEAVAEQKRAVMVNDLKKKSA